jgi:non-homologous end joining protein Ku
LSACETPSEYFDEIQDVKVTKDMLDLAKHIVTSKAANFEPEKFEDHYEAALAELINAKRNGKTIGPRPRPKGENVVDLMDALKKSIASEASAPKGKRPRRISSSPAVPRVNAANQHISVSVRPKSRSHGAIIAPRVP